MIKEKEGISAILIVFNEETIIERCLLSLKDVVDEIIVIHDGECLDQSLSIARKYTEKIFIEPHTGYAELHLIKALEYANYSWILRIDSDEYLSIDLSIHLRNMISDKAIDAYSFIWPIWDGNSYISQQLPFKPALFRIENISLEEFPQRTYSTNGKLEKSLLILEHKPAYNNYTIETFKKKWMKWIRIQAIRTYNHKDTLFYNYSQDQIARFHKQMEMQIRFAHPLLSPIWFCLSFAQFILRLKIWKNLQLFVVAYLQGLYAFNLALFIWDEKRREIEYNPWIS